MTESPNQRRGKKRLCCELVEALNQTSGQVFDLANEEGQVVLIKALDAAYKTLKTAVDDVIQHHTD